MTELTTRSTPRKRVVARPGTSIADRIALHTDRSGDCWIWTGAVDKASGYGRIQVDGKCGYAHRFSYEAHVGPIPDDRQIDHLCRVRQCCNPDHLEPVSAVVNNRRSPLTHGKETHCPQGHKYDDLNTYVVARTGQRQCRTCRDARNYLWRSTTPAERQERRDAGLPVLDIVGYFAAQERAA